MEQEREYASHLEIEEAVEQFVLTLGTVNRCLLLKNLGHVYVKSDVLRVLISRLIVHVPPAIDERFTRR